MSAQTCTAETWRGMFCYPCGRPVKDEGLCGPHLRGKRASERAAALREEKIIEAQDRLGRARSAVSRLAKAGVKALTPGWVDPPVHVEMTIEDAERLADEVERLTAALSRVEALAEGWRYKGEFGWGPWQEGYGPAPDGYILDGAATDLLRALTGKEASS